ncbi:MAG TPA: hypothetical protein VJH92_00360 [Candidatus Nanoarchaeia archaeon]|nr:hypothetical protein [Candidatus Nanoarchaeia archaeon]
MPDIFDLYIPNKDGKKSLYRLELLGDGIGSTILSLYHRRIEERKAKSGKVRQVRTYGFCFECETGKLTYASVHTGDFTKPHFRWLDSREEQFEAEKIPGVCYIQAVRYVERVCAFLDDEKEKASTYKERDRCELFLSPLEKILGWGK